MMTNIKIILVFTVIISMIVIGYMLSNDRTLAPLNETIDTVERRQESFSQPESLLPIIMNEASQATKIDQLLMAAKAEKALEAKRFLPKKMTSVLLSEQELNILKEKSQIKQAEINLLIAQYGENIHDKEKKQKLQKKVKILMTEYNELILPIALKAMQQKENG